MTTTYYKAVDAAGFSYFPIEKDKRIHWTSLIGKTLTMGDQEAWEKAVARLKEGQTAVCTKHLIHGYADLALAQDFGQRHAEERDDGETYRIIAFTGEPVTELQGALLLTTMDWDKPRKERFVDAVKYGFRSVTVLHEVIEQAE